MGEHGRAGGCRAVSPRGRRCGKPKKSSRQRQRNLGARLEPWVPPTFEEEMLKFPNNRDYAARYLLLALTPPAALLGLGLAVFWVAAGFRPSA